MKLDRLSIRTRGENFAQCGIEHILSDELVDRGTRLKMGVDRNQRLRPEALIGVGGIDLRTDFRRMNLRKGTSERLVAADQGLIEIKNIHCAPSTYSLCTRCFFFVFYPSQ